MSARHVGVRRTIRSMAALVAIAQWLGEPLRAQVVPPSPERAASVPTGVTGAGAGQGGGATASDPLARRISIDLSDVALRDALLEIARQAGVGVMYGDEVSAVRKTVTVRLDDVRAGDAFEMVLRGSGFKLTVSKTGVVVVVREEKSEAKADSGQGAAFGRVLDADNSRPLAGAVVTIKGTELRAVTTDSGWYGFPMVPAGTRTVVARYLGYQSLERTVLVVDSQAVRTDFALRMAMSRLQETVTTATGPRRRVELGNDVVLIDADSIVATQPVTSVTDLLEGRVPGLTVQRTSGAPGDPSRLRLRGASSAYLNNDPIIVVDGIRVYSSQSDSRSANLASDMYGAPSPLDYIDPNSIATIEVLKGPSAATLYGVDAANGVIVITTKKGHAGPTRWTASVDHGTSYMPGAYPDSYLRFGRMPWDGKPIFCPLTYGLGGERTECMADSVVRFQALNDPELTVLGRGHRTELVLGVSGGGQSLTYSVNGSYTDEVGLLRLPELEVERYRAVRGSNPPGWMQRPQNLARWGVTSRITAHLGASADVSLTAAVTRMEQQRSSLERQLGNLMKTYVDRSTGTYYRPTASGNDMSVIDDVLTNYYERATDETTQFTNGASLTWRPTSWLTANADAGLSVVQREDRVLLPAEAVAVNSPGKANEGRGTSLENTFNLRTTATAPLIWGFDLRTSVGANYTGRRTADLAVEADNLAPGSGSVGGAGSISRVTERAEEQATFGVYVEPQLAHKRFWLSTALRFDGGNAFGSRTKLIGLPKVSLSWLVSEESFFPFKDLFGALRLRAAYGHAGVQPGPGDRLRLYSMPASSWIDGRLVNAVTLETLGNTEIRPERSTELEGGFEADLLDDRVSIGFTGYRKTRVDALMNFPLPPSVHGGGSILRNVGVIRNTGLELSVGTELLRTEAVRWGTRLQLSHNHNEVVELGGGVDPFGLNHDQVVVAGYPLFGRWGRPVLGYTDINGDGILEASEVLYGDTAVYLGASAPNYTAALHTTLSLLRGAVLVSASLNYEDGLTQVAPWSLMRNVLRGLNDSTASLGEQARAIWATTDASLNTQTVSTLRFSSLSVSYNVPRSAAERIGASALTVSLQGTNLGLRTNYRGKDPNVNSHTTGDGVHDNMVLPQPRSWQLRVRASY